jgi:hypothetical protein
MLLKDTPSLVAFYQKILQEKPESAPFFTKAIFLFPFWDLPC